MVAVVLEVDAYIDLVGMVNRNTAVAPVVEGVAVCFFPPLVVLKSTCVILLGLRLLCVLLFLSVLVPGPLLLLFTG